MKKLELKQKIEEIKRLYSENKFDEAYLSAEKIIQKLFQEKEFEQIVEIDRRTESAPIGFEVAYAYDRVGDYEKAEEYYEMILGIPGEEENTAVLNNLSNLKKKKGDISAAFDLIKKAYELTENDEIVTRNYNDLSRLIQEQEERELRFKGAFENIKKETEWALEKLEKFIANLKKDREFVDGRIALPQWKFKALVGTDDRKAESLREQWLKKDYLRNTGERNEYNSVIYEVNPYLSRYIAKAKPAKLNCQWFDGFNEINPENLERLGYFALISKIKKTSKKYQKLLQRDLDELIFNYLVKNRKATIILSGSFVELLFTYYCDRKKLKYIDYTIQGKNFHRKIYECTLSDFLRYFEEQNNMKGVILHIGNLARIYRNFVHPGKELDSREELDDSKVEIGFHSAIEIAKVIL